MDLKYELADPDLQILLAGQILCLPRSIIALSAAHVVFY